MSRGISELLVRCTREHDWSAPDEAAAALARTIPPDRVVAAASYHRVVGCVLASLRGGEVPPETLNGLAAAARRASGYSTLALATVRSLVSTLGEDVEWLAVKGPVLDAALYPKPRLRSYRDVDVLVAPRHLRDVVDRLERDGWALADRNWQLILEKMAGEVHLQREGRAPVDLHWTLIFDKRLREIFRFDPDAMIARSRTVEVAGAGVRTLDPVDTLLHLAVHAALEGGDRLVWLKDIDVAARDDVSWDEVVRRAREYRVELPAAAMLARAARVLGAPVPEETLAVLAPRHWRMLMRVADTMFPVAASRGFGTPATLLARSARASTVATLAHAARGLGQRGRSLATGQVRRIDHRTDPAHETSLFHAVGGQFERDEYFAHLAELGRSVAGTTKAGEADARNIT